MVERLRRLLIEEGACAAGIAVAQPVDEETRRLFKQWLADGKQAGMDFLASNQELRFDPCLLLEGARSIISVAYNYRQPNPLAGVATYALGLDYHQVLRERLNRVVEKLKDDFGGEFRICIDSAPVMERYWAEKAGVGHRSPLHGNIVVPGVGSMVFLAEIITTLEFEPGSYGKGRIQAEIKSQDRGENSGKSPCPCRALEANGIIDSRKCINYLTIEHRGEWDAEQKALMGRPGADSAVFGCDLCQLADPVNHSDFPDIIPEFRCNENLNYYLSNLKRELETGIPASPAAGFSLRRSPLGRAGRKGLKRNLGSR